MTTPTLHRLLYIYDADAVGDKLYRARPPHREKSSSPNHQGHEATKSRARQAFSNGETFSRPVLWTHGNLGQIVFNQTTWLSCDNIKQELKDGNYDTLFP
jgi:hypothetical protein